MQEYINWLLKMYDKVTVKGMWYDLIQRDYVEAGLTLTESVIFYCEHYSNEAESEIIDNLIGFVESKFLERFEDYEYTKLYDKLYNIYFGEES